MKIDNSISGISPLLPGIQPLGSAAAGAAPAATGQASFGSLLREQLGELERINDNAAVMQQRMLAGDDVDLGEVATAVQKAELALSFAMQLRNKVIEAYQEINRMQV
ncbi:flagellar hook-basal body complex protein FliE [bacterium]|nr:flagellar hook-basal body complex protein FliE [bacterium]